MEIVANNLDQRAFSKRVPEPPFVFLKNGNRFEKVQLDRIYYLKAEGSYSKFVTVDREYFLSSNLLNVSNKLSNPSFLRIHRSYVVNIDNITGIDNDYVFIGEKNIPISRSYREDVNRMLKRIS